MRCGAIGRALHFRPTRRMGRTCHRQLIERLGPLDPRRGLRFGGFGNCKGHQMRSETIAIHGGYEIEPTTKAVAVPIYQTVAYAFDSAEHGAALFNLEVDGFRYTRINNPTTAVLERRGAPPQSRGEAPWPAPRRAGPQRVETTPPRGA